MKPNCVVRRRLVISGRVQGVGYRSWLGRKARTAGLVGEVRNRDDGRVEAILQGPLESIEQVIRRCHSGPLLARVSNLETTKESPQPCSVFTVIE
jgi:acylphosphatase